MRENKDTTEYIQHINLNELQLHFELSKKV